MKTSVAVLAAAAGLVMAEQPKFLNTEFNLVAGEDFTLKFSGCESGCTIELLNGPSKNLKPVRELGSDIKGSEFTFSLSDKFNTDVYAFRITAPGEDPNYSEQFTFDGASAVPATTAEETTAAEETSTSAEETSTSTVAETTTAEETTTMTTVSSDVETTSTPEASTTETESETTTGSSSEETTTSSDSDNQDDAAVRLGSSHVTLVVAAVALLGYFL
jgi:hypothetical protein